MINNQEKLTLVTGATGFIGSHLVKYLLKKGENVRVLVRNPDKLMIFGPEQNKLDIVKGDLLKINDISTALDGVDRLYHIAGFISTLPRDKDKIYKLNYDITYNLFEECSKRNIEKIVFLSSIFALGGGGSIPVDEKVDCKLGDLNADYIRAKRMSEIYVREKISEGLPIVLVYPCFCYGPGDLNNSSSKLLVLFLNKKVPGYIKGGQNVVDVRDAAIGLYLGMERGKKGEKYIIGGKNLSYCELFALLSEITGYSHPKIKLSGRMGKFIGLINQAFSSDPKLDRQSAEIMGRYWYYDDSKSRRELGYKPRPLRETLIDSINWFCIRGSAPWPPSMKKNNTAHTTQG